MAYEVRLFGIRHHGPGSARSLRAALQAYQPDAVLVEGPPDADDALPFAAHAGAKPPLALLVYVPDEPRRAGCYPFASFSPEWIAIRYGLEKRAAVRFMDLPQAHCFELERALSSAAPPAAAPADAADTDRAADSGDADGGEIDVDANDEAGERSTEGAPRLSDDPLGRLAHIAGFEDGEQWWDHLLESRGGSADADADGQIFAAVADAMAALRETAPQAAPDDRDQKIQPLREAAMRRIIRAAIADGHERIAIVCGAWHVPALRELGGKREASADAALLKSLPKVKTAFAWTPWSYEQLSFESGYGAGVASPAYYDLLWRHAQEVGVHWLTRAARLLRKQDLDASSAQVIESLRLAETLAALRARPLPGLHELLEAAHAVLCGANDAPLALIRRKLVVGDRLGSVPDDAPATPLQQDLRALQKRLRMPVSADERDYDLDLRKPLDLERSRLLHRLGLLGVDWGAPLEQQGQKGTFHELWRVCWKPQFAVDLLAAGRLGNTVAAAATAIAQQRGSAAQTLRELVELLDAALLADLPEAIGALLDSVEQRAAVGSDIPALMAATPRLARISRYGNVRRTDMQVVLRVVDELVARICVGLPSAATSLDDEAAAQMLELVNGVADAVALLAKEAQQAAWLALLKQLADQLGLHALLAGRAVRMLHDAGACDAEEIARRLSLALSLANEPLKAAGWIEGFLSGSGALLLHDEAIWLALDAWLSALHEAHFLIALPLLRRTFSTFEAAERRQMGQRVLAAAGAAASSGGASDEFDYEAADAVLPLLALILGAEQRE